MARSPFSIYTRTGKDGRKLFCARFYEEDGKPIKSVTLWKAKSPTSAARLAEAMLLEGVLPRDSNPIALDFLRLFWTRDSDYVQGRALRGVILSERYLDESILVINKHLAEPLKGKRLLDITARFMEQTILSMARNGLGARRINAAVQSVKVPYAWFCRQHRILNQLSIVEKVREHPRQRGVLTAAELAAVIGIKDESPRAIAAVLLGGLCGLRMGEVRGRLWGDVDEVGRRIEIRHNLVTESEGLKAPKWGSARSVPMPEPVVEALRMCARSSVNGRTGYVLWNERTASSAICAHTIGAGFKRILRSIGINEAEQERRNLCFHGLRHTFVTLSRALGLPDFLVQRMAGHKSMVVTERYSHAEGAIDFAAARTALEKAMETGDSKKASGG